MSRREQQEAAGRWLREARERRGFSTAGALARRMGVSDSLISRYETGVSAVSDERAEQIAEALGMDLLAVRQGLGLWVPPNMPDISAAMPKLSAGPPKWDAHTLTTRVLAGDDLDLFDPLPGEGPVQFAQRLIAMVDDDDPQDAEVIADTVQTLAKRLRARKSS